VAVKKPEEKEFFINMQCFKCEKCEHQKMVDFVWNALKVKN